MVDIPTLIDRKIDETFIIKAPKSYSTYSHVRKANTSLPPSTKRQKNILTPKVNMKEEKSLLIRAAKTRGDPQISEVSTGAGQTGKTIPDQWKAHKRIALLQHPLWVECMKGWWNVMDPHDSLGLQSEIEGEVTMEQYLDLNVRLQKALNPDFDYENACISAVEDWEIDADDWDSEVSAGETQHPCTPNSNYAESEHRITVKKFSFDKFSEFLFETGEAWCDGTIEALLVVINTTMFQISQGVHLNCSAFKDIDDISVLSDLLFQEISDMAFNSQPVQPDFVKWYHRNFLELESMRKYVTSRMFNIFPEESRINDLWVKQQGYNQTEILLLCTNRLEGLLNRIKKSDPVALPLKEQGTKRRIMGNASIQVARPSLVPQLPQLKPLENEPIVLQNKIIFTRNINLALVGHSYTARGKSQEITENLKQSGGISIIYSNSKDIKLPKVSAIKPSTSQHLGTDMTPLNSDRSFAFDSLFMKTTQKRPNSTPLHATKKAEFVRSNSYLNLHGPAGEKLFEENIEPEYTPKLKFNKKDVKYHGLQKSWRKGKFIKDFIGKGSPEIGEVNKKSPMEYFEVQKQFGKTMIETFELARQSKTQEYSRNHKEISVSKSDLAEKKDTIPSDDLEKLVGIKINVPANENPVKTTQIFNRQTAPAKLSQKPPMKSPGTLYTFGEFSHLIKQKMPPKLVFNDGLEFLYALNHAKHEFNTTHQSEFLKTYSKRFNEYRSRRDELGGFISQDDWKKFIFNLEQIIRVTKNRRKNRRLRRKKKGKVRKIPGPNMARSRLWKNVFIKPINQEKANHEKYIREFNKTENTRCESLPQALEKIVNDSRKVPVPPPYPIRKSKSRRYSPGRYRVPSSKS